MEQELKDLFVEFLHNVAKKIDRISFGQEPHYTSAFFGKLHGERLIAANGSFIEMFFSSSNDRGRGSAENKTGIDIGMVFKWTDPKTKGVFEKAVLVQATNKLLTLGQRDSDDLSAQCAKMKELTTSYVTLDCPYDGSIPTICQSDPVSPYWNKENPIRLDKYLIDTVFECLDGDKSETVIELAKRADRRLIVNTNTPKPKLKRSMSPKC